LGVNPEPLATAAGHPEGRGLAGAEPRPRRLQPLPLGACRWSGRGATREARGSGARDLRNFRGPPIDLVPAGVQGLCRRPTHPVTPKPTGAPLLHVESTTPRKVSNASDTDDLILLVVGAKDGYVERDGHMVDPADIERRAAFGH
jgi:hypothetical protein